MNSRSNSELVASPRSSRRIHRVGLIGVTGYAQAYYEGIEKLAERNEVDWGAVTIIDRNAASSQARVLEDKGVPVYSDYREMLEQEADNLDWICVPTAIGWHRVMTVDCLRRGLPVLVEKPLAPTLQDVALIQEAEREAEVTVGVGFQYLYLDETWEIKKRLLAGEIGEIERVDSLGLWPRSLTYYHRNEWSGRLHDGNFWVLDSPLHNALSHIVNLILFWTGDTMDTGADPQWLSAELYRAKPIESYDTIRTEVRVGSGVSAAVTLSHSSLQKWDPEIRITGTRGSFTWRFCGHHTFEVDGKVTFIRALGQVATRERMFASMARHLRGESVPMCTTELAKGAVKWVNAVHDTAPIADVPHEARRRLQDDAGETFDTVPGLEYALIRSFHEQKSFASVGVSWAVQPQERDLRDYRAFEGRFVPPPVPPIP